MYRWVFGVVDDLARFLSVGFSTLKVTTVFGLICLRILLVYQLFILLDLVFHVQLFLACDGSVDFNLVHFWLFQSLIQPIMLFDTRNYLIVVCEHNVLTKIRGRLKIPRCFRYFSLKYQILVKTNGNLLIINYFYFYSTAWMLSWFIVVPNSYHRQFLNLH